MSEICGPSHHGGRERRDDLPVILPLFHSRFPHLAPRSFAGHGLDAAAEIACEKMPEAEVSDPLRPSHELCEGPA